MQVEIRNHHFRLLPGKAVFWEEERTLLISDLHLGKITHFRKAGFALPPAAAHHNFLKLDELISTQSPERIIFLGDLFHDLYNEEWEMFSLWRKQYPIEMIIVMGNHDRIPTWMFQASGISVFEKDLLIGEFLFTHHPPESVPENMHVFCGHIHPVFSLRARGRQSLRLPIFVLDKQITILPSFGVFTGGYEIEPADGRNIYGIAGDKVILMTQEYSGSY